MIGQLTGQIILIHSTQVLISINGIGYEVDLSTSDVSLLHVGDTITLFTHMIIREDSHALYGFIELKSRECFRQLIKVSGIGPKIALAILSTLNVNEIETAIATQDIATLSMPSGVGKKMAERMVVELKGKFLKFEHTNDNNIHKPSLKQNLMNDLRTALINLGYHEKDILKVIKQLPDDLKDLSFGLKESLKLLTNYRSL